MSANYVEPAGGHLCSDLETVAKVDSNYWYGANPPSVGTVKGAAHSCYNFHGTL